MLINRKIPRHAIAPELKGKPVPEVVAAFLDLVMMPEYTQFSPTFAEVVNDVAESCGVSVKDVLLSTHSARTRF